MLNGTLSNSVQNAAAKRQARRHEQAQHEGSDGMAWDQIWMTVLQASIG